MASPKTEGRSPNASFVLTMADVCSSWRRTKWNSDLPLIERRVMAELIENDEVFAPEIVGMRPCLRGQIVRTRVTDKNPRHQARPDPSKNLPPTNPSRQPTSPDPGFAHPCPNPNQRRPKLSSWRTE